MISCDSVLAQMEEWVKNEMVIPPTKWIDLAYQLNVLCGDEQTKLFTLESDLAKERVGWIEGGKSVAEAKERVQSTPLWIEVHTLKAKIDRVHEMIRIAKLRARMTLDEMKG